MATAYRIIVREVLRRINGIAGATAATVDTNYGTSPLTTTQADSPVYNLAFVQDVVIDTHGRLALEIASVVDPITGIGCHPWRAFFDDVTASIAHEGALPTVGSGGSTIIGAFGRPYDAANTDQFLMPASIERVSAYKNNTGIYTNNPYLYHVNGGKVYHTTTNVVFDVCVYERSAQVTAVAANGNITLPDVLADALVFGSVANILIEDEYAAQVGVYAAYYLETIRAIRAGSMSMPGLPMNAMGMMGSQAA